MVRRLSHWIDHIASGRVTAGVLIVFLLFTALVLPNQASRAEAETGEAGSPDTSLYYSATDLYQMAESYGEQGRRAYVTARFTFDLVWPLLYTAFLATATSWLVRGTLGRASPWRKLNLVPVAGALFDYLENLATSLVMIRYPLRTGGVDLLAGFLTSVKWLLVGGSMALLLFTGLAWLWVQARRLRRAGQDRRL